MYNNNTVKFTQNSCVFPENIVVYCCITMVQIVCDINL